MAINRFTLIWVKTDIEISRAVITFSVYLSTGDRWTSPSHRSFPRSHLLHSTAGTVPNTKVSPLLTCTPNVMTIHRCLGYQIAGVNKWWLPGR